MCSNKWHSIYPISKKNRCFIKNALWRKILAFRKPQFFYEQPVIRKHSRHCSRYRRDLIAGSVQLKRSNTTAQTTAVFNVFSLIGWKAFIFLAKSLRWLLNITMFKVSYCTLIKCYFKGISMNACLEITHHTAAEFIHHHTRLATAGRTVRTIARGARPSWPPNFYHILTFCALCVERHFLKQNTVARLKSNGFPHKFWTGYATGMYDRIVASNNWEIKKAVTLLLLWSAAHIMLSAVV